MSDNTIYWYDFETFGKDPRRDRASQFAGIRTDTNLNIISEPLVLYCKPANDFLPDPMACLITGISPQKALEEGICEAEFIKRIEKEFSVPGTCVAGYNSIRFDDELTRQLLYRNFYDPYEREWKNGNSRWDIIDMVRLCAATRPGDINWPKKDDGTTSFKLEQLTLANGIQHAYAHDALADVIATIEMAKLIKRKQPKLFEYVYRLRNKQLVQSKIDMVTRKPVLHVSGMYPAAQGCLAVVMPLCPHPTNRNGIVVVDLRQDPDVWRMLSVDEIRTRVFTPKEELAGNIQRIPLKILHLNKCPIVTSPAALSAERAMEYGVNLDRCKVYWNILQSDHGVVKKIAEVFSEEHSQKEDDPDYMIYSGGFFSESDRNLMAMVRSVSPTDLCRLDLPFRDQRFPTMLYRYRARNYKETLSCQELAEWDVFRRQRLCSRQALENYQQGYAEANQKSTGADRDMLARLDQYVDSISQF